MLKPLEQFVCDTCGEIIGKPDDGWIEWLTRDETDNAYGFGIVHHNATYENHGCHRYLEHRNLNDGHLDDYVGIDKAMRFFIYLINPESKKIQVENLDEILDVFSRLTIPYYDEFIHRLDEINSNIIPQVDAMDREDLIAANRYSVERLKTIIEELDKNKQDT